MSKLYIKNTDGTYSPYNPIAISNLDIVQETGSSLTSAMSQKAVTEELTKKQDTINDLADIRSNAAKGATALQSETDPVYSADKPNLALKTEIPDISNLATKEEVAAKQDTIPDLISIRDGASSVGKVVKYTVFLPVLLLLIMAVKGCMMSGAAEGLKRFFIPDLAAFADASLWIDAVGQVFYSLSIMMAIMFAYGSYLDESSNLAEDCFIIAFSDAAISVLSGIVMFSTMGGVGMLDSMSSSGIATAFIIYPQAIVNLTSIGWVNALFGVIFYMMLVTLAIDSAFSIVEGVSASVADKFKVSPKKVTVVICGIAAVISLVYATRAGLAWLDIVDNWTNQFNLIVIGIMECIAIGWCFNLDKVLAQINLNSKKFRMPRIWFRVSIKIISPFCLFILLVWNVYSLFIKNGGHYNADYPIWAEIVAGWVVTGFVFLSGLIAKVVINHMKKKGFEEEEIIWKD